MTAQTLCISADSHVVEPPEVYAGLDKRFGDRAPRMVEHPEKGLVTDHGDGTFGFTVGVFHVLGEDWGDPAVREKAKLGFKLARPGVLNPVERLKDQAIDGVDAEVLYPSVMFSIYQLKDVAIKAATMANYNDWIHNYASQTPGRLFPLGLTQLEDIDVAIAEMERVKKLGFVGMCIPATPPPDKPYSDAFYDRFWAAAQEYNLPLAMHIFTGATANHDLPNWGIHNYTLAHVGIMRVILDLVWGGTCEKFPGLRFIPTEFDAGWIPHFNQRNDWNFQREGALRKYTNLKMFPSEYWKQNFRVTIEDDAMSIRCRDLIGVENIMWGNDYPHHDGLFPESQQTIDKMFEGVPDEDRYKITVSNACSLYGLPFEY